MQHSFTTVASTRLRDTGRGAAEEERRDHEGAEGCQRKEPGIGVQDAPPQRLCFLLRAGAAQRSRRGDSLLAFRRCMPAHRQRCSGVPRQPWSAAMRGLYSVPTHGNSTAAAPLARTSCSATKYKIMWGCSDCSHVVLTVLSSQTPLIMPNRPCQTIYVGVLGPTRHLQGRGVWRRSW